MMILKLSTFMNREDIDAMEKIYSEKAGERVIILPAFLDAVNSKVLYLCDRRACKQCSPECKHTADIKHAKNFCLFHDVFIEEG